MIYPKNTIVYIQDQDMRQNPFIAIVMGYKFDTNFSVIRVLLSEKTSHSHEVAIFNEFIKFTINESLETIKNFKNLKEFRETFPEYFI